MTNPPRGRLSAARDGSELIVSRTFNAPIEDVWASVTEPERTARWFGPWQGEPGQGRTIRMQMAYEEQQPWFDVLIEVCEAPRHLAVSTGDDSGGWRLELRLSQVGDHTELLLVHHLADTEQVGEFGPGWEYYLDLLVSARDGSAAPNFSDYYPSMRPYYAGLALDRPAS